MAKEDNKAASKPKLALFSKKDDKKPAANTAKKEVAKKDGKKRRGPIRYIRDVWQELKKVTWPTRKELVRAVLAVVCFVFVFTLLIWLMNLAVTPGFKWLIS